MSSIWNRLVDLTKNVFGILPTANGGTGVNSTATFPTSGTVVTETATETLTNKTLTTPTINGATLSIDETGSAFNMNIRATAGDPYTANRTLTIATGDRNTQMDLVGDLSLGGNFTTNDTVSLFATGVTNVTLPTTGTLATLAGTETLTNKTISLTGNTLSGLTTGSIPFAGASALTQDNAKLFWDDTNFRLGIGTNTPTWALDIPGITGQARVGGTLFGDWPSAAGYAFFGNSSLDQTATGNYAVVQSTDGITYINAVTGKGIHFNENNSEKMTIAAGGNVGIGTTTPAQKLSLPGDNRAILGTALVGAWPPASAFAMFGTNALDQTSVGNYGLVQTDGGDTYLNAPTGQVIHFAINASEKARFDSSGNFGIATTSPTSLLSVGASSQFQVNSSGDIVKINNVTTSFPASQGAASTFLQNNGSGTLSWVAGMTNPLTTTGDLIYGVGTTPTRLAGSTGVLHSSGAAAPTWSTIVNADVDAAAAIEGSKIVSAASGVAGVVNTTGQVFTGAKDLETAGNRMKGGTDGTNQAAGYIGEFVVQKFTSSNASNGSSSPFECANITLTAGRWWVWATLQNTKVASQTETFMYVSNTSASSSGTTEGYSRTQFSIGALSGSAICSLSLGPIDQSLSGTPTSPTVYLNAGQTGGTMAAANWKGTIYAIRIG